MILPLPLASAGLPVSSISSRSVKGANRLKGSRLNIRTPSQGVLSSSWWRAVRIGLWLLLVLSVTAKAQTYSPGITVAGNQVRWSTAYNLDTPMGVVIDKSGNSYVADYYNNRIQKFPPNSTSATAGTTVAGGNGFGSGSNQLTYPSGLFLDGAGALYVADYYNHRIQKFPPNSTSATTGTTVAGLGTYGSGPAALNHPFGVVVDKAGFIYVADAANNRIQKFPPNSAQGTSATTVAGNGTYGSAPDQLSSPTGLAVDASGYIYVADLGNHRIQKFPPNSTATTSGTTVAGVGTAGRTRFALNEPTSVIIDTSGALYVADAANNRIQKFPPDSEQGTWATTVAGSPTGRRGASADQLNYPFGIAIDESGAIYVSDQLNNRIQKFSVCQGVTLQPVSGSAVCAGSTITVSVSTSGTVTGFQWYKDGIALTSPASATTATLNLEGVSPTSTGNYTVQVSGACNSIISTPFSLTVNDLPTAASASSSAPIGSIISLSATGGDTYQWRAPTGASFTSPTTASVVSASLTVAGPQAFTVLVSQGSCSQTLIVSVTAVAADLTPILYARPSTVRNTTNISVVIDVAEVNDVPTTGSITVKVTKDPNATLNWIANASTIGGRQVQNSAWRFDDSDADYYILTTSQSIEAGYQLSFGFTGQLTPGATTGTLTISAVLVGGSGGETRFSNNVDADKVDYFQ